jgi:hypothetical protein
MRSVRRRTEVVLNLKLLVRGPVWAGRGMVAWA